MTNGKGFIILWLGVDEFEFVEGSLNEAIHEVKQNSRYCNYGRKGAIIVKAEKMYEINEDGVELLRGPVEEGID